MMEQIYNMPVWLKTFWGNSVIDYVIAFVALLVFSLAFMLLQKIVLRSLRQLSKKTKTDIDDTLIEVVDSIRPKFYTFVALYAALQFLVLHPTLQTVLNTLLLIWVAYQVVVAIQILIDYVVKKKFFKGEEDEGSKGIISFITGLLKASLWVFAALAILSNLGVNINSMIAGLGIGGLAIAFALQNILADLFSSFAIHVDKPFKVGDYIVAGEHSGVVQKIGIKTTRLRALQGEEIVISNGELTGARVQNFKKLEERRVSFDIGITYETPQEKVRKITEIIGNAISGTEHTRFDRSHFMNFGDSALIFTTVYYVESNDYVDYANARQEINFKIMEGFAKEGIEMAYPTQTVFIKN
ncbi:mechanosensitive ion channel family protein [Patescibacteria group bacterium]